MSDVGIDGFLLFARKKRYPSRLIAESEAAVIGGPSESLGGEALEVECVGEGVGFGFTQVDTPVVVGDSEPVSLGAKAQACWNARCGEGLECHGGLGIPQAYRSVEACGGDLRRLRMNRKADDALGVSLEGVEQGGSLGIPQAECIVEACGGQPIAFGVIGEVVDGGCVAE